MNTCFEGIICRNSHCFGHVMPCQAALGPKLHVKNGKNNETAQNHSIRTVVDATICVDILFYSKCELSCWDFFR